MSELTSAVLGVALVFGVAMPLLTLIAKAVLAARWRHDPDPRRQGSLLSFLLLVLPSLGALLWFISAAFHVSEPGAGPEGCILDHAGAAACIDTLLFGLLLVGAATGALTRGWRRYASGSGAVADSPPPEAQEQVLRVARLCAGSPALTRLRARVAVVRDGSHPLCTRGLLRPRIEIASRLVDALDDRALTAALLHESEHLVDRDPLRYLIAGASLALNPFGFLLRPELRRWRAAREAVCDEGAVRRLADPLALAQALVAAARYRRPVDPYVAALCGEDHGLLQLRVHLLLGYVARPPGRPARRSLWLGLSAATALLLGPHILGAWPLDHAHLALERALAALGLL